MKGDQLTLPIHGAIRKHEWTPKMQTPTVQNKSPRHRASPVRDGTFDPREFLAVRKSILAHLAKGDMTHGQLVKAVGRSKSATSSNLFWLVKHSQVQIVGESVTRTANETTRRVRIYRLVKP